MKKSFLILTIFCIFSVKAICANYYWIGGTGNWTDLKHWATTSGGATLQNEIPTALDDVFFDANSFSAAGQIVTLDALTIFVHDMTWTGVTNNPTLAGTSATLLKIYGSLTFVAGMNLTYAGQVNFEAATPGKTITSAGKSFINNISFNGIGGGWTLQDAFATTLLLFLNNGTLTTNNQTVNAVSFVSISGTARTLNMGSSIFNFSLSYYFFDGISYAGGFWYVAPTGMTLNCGTSTINATGNNNLYNTRFYGGGLTYYNLNFVDANSGGGEIWGNNIFHNVSFASNGFIFENNTYNNLSFTAGYRYVLTDGRTQIINGALIASGNCNGLITINSSISGNQTTISHPPGAVLFSFVALKDIKAVGGAIFTANNTVDLGNNTGWTINPLIGKKLYWIGNSGNWDDGNHWSLSSGGPASGCSPTPLDNVFFDDKSFTLTGQTTTINAPTAHCRDMTWTGVTNNPTLAGANTNLLKIYGSLTFVAGMNLSFEGKVNFEATSLGKTITSAGKTFTNWVSFNGVGGSWTLQDSLTTTSVLFLNNGILTTNNQTINALSFTSNSGTARTLNMGSSIFNLSLVYSYFDNGVWYSGGFWFVDPTGMTLNCGTSTINSSGDNTGEYYFSGGGLTYYNLNFGSTRSRGEYIFGNNIFHDVSFASNGFITDNNIYNNLAFAAAKTYVLTDSRTQTINGALIATGNCNGLIAINSSISGSQSTISHSPGAVVVSYVSLKDIKTIGGATFTANNAVDLGNNTGWTINPLTGKNLYWIGNSGNWDDGNHWSLSSGGPPSGCSPTPLDNVFFDDKSFTLAGQIIMINVSTAYCLDMTWTGVTNNPSLNGAYENILKIYGSLTFVAGMNLNFSGKVNFEATIIGKTIALAGKSFWNEVSFNGIGGGWTLQDTFRTTYILSLNNGILTTNNQTVNAGIFYSQSGTARTLNMGSSIFNLSSAYSFWSVNPTGMTLNCGTSTINSTSDGSGVYSNFEGGSLTYYDLNFLGAYSSNGEIFANNNFHNVSFASNGYIAGNNSYNNLTFSAGYTYVLESGKTQTILGKFLIQGSCISYIFLKSSVAGSFSTITKAGGPVLGFNIHMRDIKATGGANFIAYNSVDLGGNSGWNFLSLPALGNLGVVAGPTSVCEGVKGISYSLAPVIGAITYQWTVPPGATITGGQGDTLINVNYAGASSGDVTVTASSGCEFSFKKTVLVVVNANLAPDLVVAANTGNTVCAGSSVTFTATPTNGGTTPTYQWQVNGVNAGTNSPTFTTSTLANGDIVKAIMTANPSCASPPSATSTPITMTVNPVLTPSIIITTGSSTICAGASVTFTATPTNGGTTPVYQWQVNGVNAGSNSPAFTTNTLVNGDIINVTLTSNATCASPAKTTSNAITIAVTATVIPSVDITTGSTIICAGSNAAFTATPTNGGTTPTYQWQLNASNVGTNSPTYINNTLANGDVVKVTMTSNSTCASPTTATSVPITMAVNPVLTPTVNIATGSTTICASSSVTFTATPTNEGATPVYQWQVNGSNVGTNSPTFTNIALANGDIVKIILTSNATCATPATVTSTPITMTVNPVLTPSIINVPSATTICAGTSVTFNATPTNGGTTPVYQWQVNGANAGTNSPTYTTSTLVNGDIIKVILTSNAICATPATATSAPITMTVNPMVTPSVSIATGSTTICTGTSVTFTATPKNGGIPSYQWQLNGVNVGTNSSTYTSTTLADGDIVNATMTSSAACATTTIAISNSLAITIVPNKNPSVSIIVSPITICYGTEVTFTATPINGGNSPSYQWKVDNINAGKNSPTFITKKLANGNIVNCILTSNTQCATPNPVTSNSITISIDPTICPQNFYIPNAFTPNNDGKNDIFKPTVYGNIVQYNMSIYNRWGQKVFETTELENGWDGKIKGADVETSVLVWLCTFKFEGKSLEMRKGTVVLIR